MSNASVLASDKVIVIVIIELSDDFNVSSDAIVVLILLVFLILSNLLVVAFTPSKLDFTSTAVIVDTMSAGSDTSTFDE